MYDSQIPVPSIPTWKPSDKNVDKLFAQSFNQLATKERENALHDLHGVSDIVLEQDNNVTEGLRNMDIAISNNPSKEAYDTAFSLSESYVSRREFRLQFLRAENYNSERAAARMVRHFENKLELFGKERLVSDIRTADLDADILSSGYLQLLPQRDRAGRAMMFVDRRALPPNATSLQRRQLFWYMAMSSLEDEETQMKGMIFIYYAVDCEQKGRKMERSNVNLVFTTRAVPIKFVGVHACYNSQILKPFFNLAAYAMEATMRVRLRYHTGAPMEIFYALMTFGIPRILLPLDECGVLSNVNHNEWIETRKRLEARLMQAKQEMINSSQPKNSNHNEQTAKMDVEKNANIVVPGPEDVLLGRGKAIEGNPGNLRLRHLIEVNGREYDEASKFEKTVVSQSILGIIKEKGGRFLKKSPTGWNEVSDDMARDKISHAFRNNRGKILKMNKNRAVASNTTKIPFTQWNHMHSFPEASLTGFSMPAMSSHGSEGKRMRRQVAW